MFGNSKDEQRLKNSILFGAPATDDEMGEIMPIVGVVALVVTVIVIIALAI